MAGGNKYRDNRGAEPPGAGAGMGLGRDGPGTGLVIGAEDAWAVPGYEAEAAAYEAAQERLAARGADDGASGTTPSGGQIKVGPPPPRPAYQQPQLGLQRVGQVFGSSSQQTVLPADVKALGRDATSSLEDAYVKQQKAANETTAILVDEMAQRGAIAGEMTKYEGASALDQESAILAHRKQVRQHMMEIDAAQRKASEASVDPDNFWKQRGLGGRALGALAMALGEIGRAFIGGSNPAMTIINAAIERDIDAQRAKIAGLKSNAAAKVNMLGALRAQFADDQQATAVARDLRMKEFAARLRQISEQSAGSKLAAEAKSAEGKLQLQRAAGIMDIYKTRGQMEGKQVSSQAQTQMGISKAGKVDDTQKRADVAQSTLDELEQLFRSAGPVDAAAGSTGVTSKFNEVASQYEPLRQELAYAMARLVDTGRLSDQDYSIRIKMIPSLTRALPGMRDAALKAFARIRGTLIRAAAVNDGTYTINSASRKRLNELNRQLGIKAQL